MLRGCSMHFRYESVRRISGWHIQETDSGKGNRCTSQTDVFTWGGRLRWGWGRAITSWRSAIHKRGDRPRPPMSGPLQPCRRTQVQAVCFGLMPPHPPPPPPAPELLPVVLGMVPKDGPGTAVHSCGACW